MRIFLLAGFFFWWLLPSTSYGGSQGAHNVILMVSDGMGLADITAARLFRGGESAAPLTLEKLPVIGYQRTYSSNSVITDSAAAASAFATGIKHMNGQISCGITSPSCSNPPPTILEIAKNLGKATGLVATSAITHATPAAFGSHVSSRYCQGEIGRQLIMKTGVDVLLGGGIDINSTQFPELCRDYANPTAEETIDLARSQNYAVVTTKEDLISAANNSRQILGVFGKVSKTLETFYLDNSVRYPANEPTLAEMTEAALASLAKDPDGFFLMVEGSQVDWRKHDNDTPGMIAEVLGFDAAVNVVVKKLTEWLVDPKTRHLGTLLIVVSDHETGGFAIEGPDGEAPTKGMIVDTDWITKHHTGVDTVIWSQGPGSAKLGHAVNNTDIFQVMKEAIAPGGAFSLSPQ